MIIVTKMGTKLLSTLNAYEMRISVRKSIKVNKNE